MMKLTIDRSRWLRGETAEKSYLCRPRDKKMCCLGFLALQCGYTLEDITDSETPLLANGNNKFPDSIVEGDEHTEVCCALMRINDDGKLKEYERESKLKTLFKQADILVEFIN